MELETTAAFACITEAIKSNVFILDDYGSPVKDSNDKWQYVDSSETFVTLDEIHRRNGVLLTIDKVNVTPCKCGELPEWKRGPGKLVCICGEESPVVSKDYGREPYRKMEANRLFNGK